MDVSTELRRLLHVHLPAHALESFRDDLALGASGLGLDSVALVELLLACEERFGTPVPEDMIRATLTISELTRFIERYRRE